MTNADELRRISLNSRKETNRAQLTDVINECTERAKSDKNDCFYYKALSDTTQKFLISEGYEVQNLSSQRDGTCFKISW